MLYNYPYAINVDWLQVFCHDGNTGNLASIYFEKSAYEFQLLPHGSRHFKELWEVHNEDGDKYAIIQRVPHSSIISADGAIIQLCNRELYRPHYAAEFLLFLSAHKFSYKSISRLDVCFDSNVLRNRLRHSTFITKIMQGLVLKNNQSGVQWNFSSIANVGKPMECNSCSFGSKSSGVSTKMYNKTLEMKEQTNKPYISENWVCNGLNVNEDVWRIEISIKSDSSTTIRTESGEIFRISADSLKMQNMVEDIFFSYAKKYFSFKTNTGRKNKTRMPEFLIFPDERIATLHPVRITECKDSGRGDRIFLKKLLSLQNEFAKADNQTFTALKEVINTFTLTRNLEVWKMKNFNEGLYRKTYEQAQQKVLQEDIQSLVQRLLDAHPRGASEIHNLVTLIYSILNK